MMCSGTTHGKNFDLWKVMDIKRAIDATAEQNEYHPVRDYLYGLQEWDRVPRIERLFTDYCGVECIGVGERRYDLAGSQAEYLARLGWCIFGGVVSRVLEGSKHEILPILEGEQGVGKTSFVKALVPCEEWYGEVTASDLEGGRNTIEALEGFLILEWGELGGVRNTEIGLIKKLLSSTSTSARKAYGIATTVFEHRFIIIGTTNEDRYLKDSTGNRRFFPVKVGVRHDIKINEIKKDLDQFYAETMHHYKNKTMPKLYIDINDTKDRASLYFKYISREKRVWLEQEGFIMNIATSLINFKQSSRNRSPDKYSDYISINEIKGMARDCQVNIHDCLTHEHIARDAIMSNLRSEETFRFRHVDNHIAKVLRANGLINSRQRDKNGLKVNCWSCP
jgi:predicted P-loop ATPase